MKRVVVFAALLAVSFWAVASSDGSRQSSRRERKTIIIRVTSSDPQEPLEFVASYLLVTSESPLVNVAEKTPFEVKAESNFVAGIFRKKAGSGALQVAVSTSSDGQEEEKQAEGGGDIVIIGTQPEHNHRIVAQALSQR
ncbi:MAG: hypothetical protein JOZ02_24050 [Acidobacteria bacterium]|nr:hypothetical protein [Acidobacteriota bacterium]